MLCNNFSQQETTSVQTNVIPDESFLNIPPNSLNAISIDIAFSELVGMLTPVFETII